MKYLIRSLYVILPAIFCLVIHLLFWYGNSFEPLRTWDGFTRGMAVFLMLVVTFLGGAWAYNINLDYNYDNKQ